jgi:putative aminopeptidase FrvX
MTQTTDFLKSLISTAGLSGFETPVARLIEEKWHPLTDELSLSPLGSLHGLKRGTGKKRSIMIATHMDAIGLIVSKVKGEFLHVANLGGVDIRVLPGQAVTVHTESGELPGIVVQPPAYLLPDGAAKGAVALKNLLVDVGLSASQVKRKVQIGDTISFATEPIELSGGLLSGHSLDNRASVATLTLCLEELQSREHVWDVWAAATVQEEIGHMGAGTSAFQIRPDVAIAVDVTFAKGPGAGGWEAFDLGSGPTLGWGSVNHPFLYAQFKELAEKLEMPIGMEILPGRSGTDGDDLQITAEGIPTLVISIPIRYMHTPVEMIATKDIQRTARLLSEFIAMLDEDFLEKIVWDD